MLPPSLDLPYVVEPMGLQDVPEVMEIERCVFPAPWPTRAYEYELVHNPSSCYLVVRLIAPVKPHPQAPQRSVSHGPLVAYGGFWLMVDEAHICTLAVHPDWRRRGLGELTLVKLLERAIEMRAEVATLEVRISNLPAQNLYRKYGFAVVGLRKAYYSDNNEDALIMTSEPLCSLAFQRRLTSLRQALYERLRSTPLPQAVST